jgi:hypothetical protein
VAAEEGYVGRGPRRVLNRLASPLYLDLGGDHRDSVFLAGSGRSGTTWVSEIVNHQNEYRYVFEPFHPGKVKLVKDFRWKQYLRPDDAREEFLEPARRILSGRVRSLWTDRFHRRFVARRRLVKDARANLLLGWMRANFPGMPILLLLRHPCAVAFSKMKLGWPSRIEELLGQPELVDDFLRPFVDRGRAAKTDFEQHVFVWCVENYVPLTQLRGDDAHLLFYENLLREPEEALRFLPAAHGASFDGSVLEKAKRPSSTSRKGSQVFVGGSRAVGWRHELRSDQFSQAAEILGLFGLDGVYDAADPMPNPDGAHALMRR